MILEKGTIVELRAVWRCLVNGWYGLLLAISKAFGVVALAGATARGFVAFSMWRTAFRNRLLGADTRQEAG